MPSPTTFAQLAARFQSAQSLPAMPTAALKVSRLLESDATSSAELERAIMNDPALSTALLRAASSAVFGSNFGRVTTVRAAIMRLGTKAIKSVAVSLWTQSIITRSRNNSTLDTRRFTDHCLFVGYLARYLFASRTRRDRFETKWGPDEVFAAGVLHDLGPGLLSVVDGQAFDRVHGLARAKNVSFNGGFRRIYGRSVHELGLSAVRTWGLDDFFGEVIATFEVPESHPSEAIAVSCIHLADQIASHNGHQILRLPVDPCSEFAVREVGIPPEDVPTVVELTETLTRERGDRRAA